LLDPDYMNADVLHYSSDCMISFELILQAINVKLRTPSILMYAKLQKTSERVIKKRRLH